MRAAQETFKCACTACMELLQQLVHSLQKSVCCAICGRLAIRRRNSFDGERKILAFGWYLTRELSHPHCRAPRLRRGDRWCRVGHNCCRVLGHLIKTSPGGARHSDSLSRPPRPTLGVIEKKLTLLERLFQRTLGVPTYV